MSRRAAFRSGAALSLRCAVTVVVEAAWRCWSLPAAAAVTALGACIEQALDFILVHEARFGHHPEIYGDFSAKAQTLKACLRKA